MLATLPGLTGLRFIAAFCVFFDHLVGARESTNLGRPPFSPSASIGVTLFFVLSGFLITYRLLAEQKETGSIDIRRFYTRRILRIWPLYYLFTFLTFFILPHVEFLRFPGLDMAVQGDYLRRLALYLLISPHFAVVLYRDPGVGGPLWSVGVEEYFYLMWPHLLKRAKKGLPLVLGGVIALPIILRQCTHGFWPEFFRLFRIDCMAIGGIGAWIYLHRRDWIRFLFPIPVQLAAYALAIRNLLCRPHYGSFEHEIHSIAFMIIIVNVALNPKTLLKFKNRIFEYMGKISYGFYIFQWLSHVICINLYLKLGGIQDEFLRTMVLLAGDFALTTTFASASYYLWERRFLILKQHFSPTRVSPRAQDEMRALAIKSVDVSDWRLQYLPWAASLPFLPALGAGFVALRDRARFADNAAFGVFSWAQLKWMFGSFQVDGAYQPLAWLSHALDILLCGLFPPTLRVASALHAVNLLIYAGTAVVFYRLGVRLLGLAFLYEEEVQRGWLKSCAAFSALLFALHPMRVEVVAWASCRGYLLAGLFFLLALDLYLQIGVGERGGRRGMLACAALLAASLLCEPIGLSFPLIALVLDYYPLRRFEGLDLRGLKRLIVEKLPLFAVSGIVMIVVERGHLLYAPTTAGASGLARAVFGLGFYLEKTVAPIHLAPIYPLPANLSLSGAACLPVALACSGLTVVAFAQRRARPWLLAVWLAFLAAAMPSWTGLLDDGVARVAADRWSYLPAMGWAILAGGLLFDGLRRADGRLRLMLGGGAAVTLLLLAGLSFRQSGEWRDTETLMTANLASYPDCDACRDQLLSYSRGSGRQQDTLDSALLAMRLRPDDTGVLLGVGSAYEALGRFADAVATGRRMVELQPRVPAWHYDLGYFAFRAGDLDLAIAETRKALELDPSMANAQKNLAYYLSREPAGPPHAPAAAQENLNRGVALVQTSKFAQAENEFRQALSLNPQLIPAHYNLAYVLHMQGRLPEAEAEYRRTLQLDPRAANATRNLGVLLTAEGRLEEAGQVCAQWALLEPGATNPYCYRKPGR